MLKNNRIREIFYYKRFYLDFFENLSLEVRTKLNWTLQLIATVERVPAKFLAHIEGSKGLYEIRVKVGRNNYRVFCFFDEGNLIILMNAFLKKTRKTPKNELRLANKIKREYFDEK